MLKVKPHSMEAAALVATEATLAALPMGGARFQRNETGMIMIDSDGYISLEARDEEFIAFACSQQGYVAGVLINYEAYAKGSAHGGNRLA